MRAFRLPFLIVTLSVAMLLLGWELGGAYQRSLLLGEPFWKMGVVQTGSGSGTSGPDQENFDLLRSVWRILQSRYIAPEKLSENKLLLGAAEGFVRGVGDPYTVFMSPEESKNFNDVLQGTLEGIGAELKEVEGRVIVVAPLRGSPAEKAGVRAGDIIALVDGKSVEGLSLNEIVNLIRGKKGTSVTLQIEREGEASPLILTITRATVSVPTVESKAISATGASIGYIALNQFGGGSMEEVRTAIRSFQGKDLAGIVLDLRGNGGGYLEGAVELASMFLTQGRVVTVESRGEGTKPYDVSGRPLLPDLPLVILIDQGTASASEIVAGALQDHGRATIIGKQSFGKGTVQEVIDLSGGSSLRVTVARWLTPKGKDLGKEGVTPDRVVERGKDDSPGGKDAQLDAAIRLLLTQSGTADKQN